MKTSWIVIPVFLLIILVLGCISGDNSNTNPITSIVLPGHNVEYTFSNDIRKSVLVNATDETQIRNLFMTEKSLTIVFNGTDETDNGMFRIALIDITSRVPFYLAYEGTSLSITANYFLNEDGTETWYDYGSNPIMKPNLTGLVLWLKGPATGALDTSVQLDGTTVYLQGTDIKNMSLAADKLSLIVMGINKETLNNLTVQK